MQKHTAGVAPDGRPFRSENGNPLQPSTWWQVWQKVRAASLTPEQLVSPLASHDDRGGSSAHRNLKATRRGR
jgi:hypothetical protein